MDAFIGTILPVAFNYPPRGWVFCNGQIMPIAQNSALFALLGTMYGGDGMSTFGIPDLRGRVIVGSQGAGPGLTPVQQGEKAGTNNTTVISSGTTSFTLSINNLPSHTHTGTVDTSALTATTTVTVGTGTNGGVGAVLNNGGLTSTASGSAPAAAIYLPASTAPTSPVNLGGVSTLIGGTASVNNSNTGNGQAVAAPVSTTANISIMQPYLGINYILATEGIFPSRN